MRTLSIRSGWRATALVFVALLLLVSPGVEFAVGATSLNATSISVSMVPSKLPADGLSYPSVVVSLDDSAGAPTLALNDTTVYLSLSQGNIGSIPSAVVIPTGATFVIANFTTTTTQGDATITASSQGLASATAQVVTVTPSGFPTHITVFASPSELLARPQDNGTLFLELTDDQGLPAKAPSSFTVSLFSSATSVVSLPQSTVEFDSSEILVTAPFLTSFTPGWAAITASASGYISGGTTITVVGPEPLNLVASAQPSSLVVNSSGILMISLADGAGDPARAAAPVTVTLRSSNTTVATVPNSLIVPPGSIYAWVAFNSTACTGTATLTATSPGLMASSAAVTTYPAGEGPVSLKVIPVLPLLLSDDAQYKNAVIIELLGKDSHPATAGLGGYDISVTSSDSLVGNVPDDLTIAAGASYAVAYFRSTFQSGTTTVTASATNLSPGSATLTSYGPVPYQISLSTYGSGNSGTSTSTEIPADGGSYPALAVSLVSAGGSPAIAPSNINVQLSSSNTAILLVNTSVTIAEGTIGTIVPLKTTLVSGTANITASSGGLNTGSLSVATEIPAPARLEAFVAPPVTLDPVTGNLPVLYVQLQDGNGNPAMARQTTRVVVTSSNGAVLNSPISLSIPAGVDFVRLPLSALGAGTTTLTVSSSGLASSTATVQLTAFPLTASLTLSTPSYIYYDQSDVATIHLTVLGQPVKGATVVWSSTGDLVMSAKNGTTNAAGQLSVVVTPGGLGGGDVTATATGASFGRILLNASLTVQPVPPPPSPTISQLLLRYIYYIIGAVAVIVAVSAYFARRSRIKARAEMEASFETVS